MDLIELKWILLSVLLITTFIFGLLPLKLIRLHSTADQVQHARYENIIGVLSCFAAGVFMGTGLLDLFPDVKELLSQANIYNYMKSSFPVAEFTISVGFFLVLILEQIVKDCKERHPNSYSVEETSDETNIIQTQHAEDVHHTEQGNDSNPEYVPEPHSTLRSIILLLALSLHSLFEGLAIGLQLSKKGVFQMFTAVIIHKVIIAFSLGLNLVQSNLSLGSVIKSILLFSLTSPIGMGIAIAVEKFGQNAYSSIINGILQGLACGTFVYVTFFEILPHELLKNSSNRLLKLVALLLGFSVVCLVLFLDPSETQTCDKF